MSTLAGKDNYFVKLAFRYVIFTMFTALFSAVYEYFSFGVYSNYMLYAYAFPFVGGVFLFLGLSFSKKERTLGKRGLMLYHYGIITLTTGSLISGVVDIYGTTNRLTKIYWIAGGFLIVSGLVMAVHFSGRKEEEHRIGN